MNQPPTVVPAQCPRAAIFFTAASIQLLALSVITRWLTSPAWTQSVEGVGPASVRAQVFAVGGAVFWGLAASALVVAGLASRKLINWISWVVAVYTTVMAVTYLSDRTASASTPTAMLYVPHVAALTYAGAVVLVVTLGALVMPIGYRWLGFGGLTARRGALEQAGAALLLGGWLFLNAARAGLLHSNVRSLDASAGMIAFGAVALFGAGVASLSWRLTWAVARQWRPPSAPWSAALAWPASGGTPATAATPVDAADPPRHAAPAYPIPSTDPAKHFALLDLTDPQSCETPSGERRRA